jgi:hypothetical protein
MTALEPRNIIRHPAYRCNFFLSFSAKAVFFLPPLGASRL